MDTNLEAARAFIDTLDDDVFTREYVARLQDAENMRDFLTCVDGLFMDKIAHLAVRARADRTSELASKSGG